MEGSDAVDEISREVQLKTYADLKQCFKKLSKTMQDARFEDLCARVVRNSSTASTEDPHAGPSASRVSGPVPAASSATSRFRGAYWEDAVGPIPSVCAGSTGSSMCLVRQLCLGAS